MNRIASLFDELIAHWGKMSETPGNAGPHEKQVDAIKSVIMTECPANCIEWGRRTGKGDTLAAIHGLWGQVVPGSQSYYFSPIRKETERIMWKSGKITDVIPGNWIDSMNSSAMQVYWANSPLCKHTGRREGWWILDGLDNHDAARGIEPKRGILSLDEVREMTEELWYVLEPILARWRSPYIMTTTPPDSLVDDNDPEKPHWVIAHFDRVAAKPEGKGFYSHATSYANPHLDHEWLDEKIQDLTDKGDEDVAQREYLAKRVPKKQGRIFAAVMKPEHFREHDDLMARLESEIDLIDWYGLTDPASRSVWAWNFVGVHRYTKKVYILDEMDETNQGRMLTTVMWPEALKCITALQPKFDEWSLHYDEAEAWFANEMIDKYDVPFQPSDKRKQSKSEGFALIKDLFYADMLIISKRCIHTWNELLNYEDEKSRDHHVDLVRYLLNVSGYSAVTAKAPTEKSDVQRRKERYRMDDVVSEQIEGDWTSGIA